MARSSLKQKLRLTPDTLILKSLKYCRMMGQMIASKSGVRSACTQKITLKIRSGSFSDGSKETTFCSENSLKKSSITLRSRECCTKMRMRVLL